MDCKWSLKFKKAAVRRLWQWLWTSNDFRVLPGHVLQSFWTSPASLVFSCNLQLRKTPAFVTCCWSLCAPGFKGFIAKDEDEKKQYSDNPFQKVVALPRSLRSLLVPEANTGIGDDKNWQELTYLTFCHISGPCLTRHNLSEAMDSCRVGKRLESHISSEATDVHILSHLVTSCLHAKLEECHIQCLSLQQNSCVLGFSGSPWVSALFLEGRNLASDLRFWEVDLYTVSFLGRDPKKSKKKKRLSKKSQRQTKRVFEIIWYKLWYKTFLRWNLCGKYD